MTATRASNVDCPACEVALEDPADLAVCLALDSSSFDVGACCGVVDHADHRDDVQRPIELSVAAAVEAVSGGVAAGGGDRVSRRRSSSSAAEAGLDECSDASGVRRELVHYPHDVAAAAVLGLTTVFGHPSSSTAMGRAVPRRWALRPIRGLSVRPVQHLDHIVLPVRDLAQVALSTNVHLLHWGTGCCASWMARPAWEHRLPIYKDAEAA